MKAKSLVEHIRFDTADEFMDALLPRGKYFGADDLPFQWIFRGHSNAKYQLIPSALRLPLPEENPLYLKTLEGWFPVDDRWHLNMLVIAELRTLIEFLEIADQNGLSVPGDSLQLRGELYKFLYSLTSYPEQLGATQQWPIDAALSLMALAQHHGVPTRLLDWTYSSYTAAYFAASEAAQKLKKNNGEVSPDDELAVWAFSESAYRLDSALPHLSERTVQLINVPTAGNVNLYAQRGVFMLNRITKESVQQRVDRTPLDKVIENTITSLKFDDPELAVTILYELKLPVTESPKLLRYLAMEGFNGARLFPGYNGVAKALMEQNYWDKPI